MPPKRVPMVSTGRPSAQAIAEVSTTAIRKAGQWGRQAPHGEDAGDRHDGDREAAGLTVGRAPASAPSLGTIGPGSPPASVRPSISLSWLARMIRAMPAVNPTVTG